MSIKATVIIPTLNESENIEELANMIISNSDVDILIIDDDSTDGSEVILCRLKEKHEKFNFYIRKKDHGYGKSCLDGFNIATKSGCEIILTMDADLSHPPLKIKELINVMNNFDIAICSRYIDGGEIEAN